MFALIESSRSHAHARGLPGGALSFAAHSVLAALAVWFTRPVAAVLTLPPRETAVVWPLPPGRVVPAPGQLHPPARPAPGVVLPPPGIPADIPPLPDPALPGPVLPGLPGPLVCAPAGTPCALPGVVPGTPPMVPPQSPVDVRYVEVPPQLIGHPPLRYPDLLRQAGVEGRVVLEAVLDTTGRVEPATLRVSSGAHALFEAEARAVALASRYRPARVSGRPVRVRILLPVAFAVRR